MVSTSQSTKWVGRLVQAADPAEPSLHPARHLLQPLALRPPPQLHGGHVLQTPACRACCGRVGAAMWVRGQAGWAVRRGVLTFTFSPKHSSIGCHLIRIRKCFVLIVSFCCCSPFCLDLVDELCCVCGHMIVVWPRAVCKHASRWHLRYGARLQPARPAPFSAGLLSSTRVRPCEMSDEVQQVGGLGQRCNATARCVGSLVP
jgi:hypothetical protein